MQKFKWFDHYGEKVELTYKGESTFKTKAGAFVSIIIYLILMIYLGYKLSVMI